MANVDNPHGFRSLGRNVYGGPTQALRAYKLAALGTAAFIGDACGKVTGGATEKIPVMTIAPTPGTTPFLGVNMTYGAASTKTYHQLIAASGEVFEAQEDAAGGATIGADDVNTNCDIICGAGSATTLLSGHELDSDTADATATRDCEVLGLLDVPDNAWGDYCRVMVVFKRVGSTAGVIGVA